MGVGIPQFPKQRLSGVYTGARRRPDLPTNLDAGAIERSVLSDAFDLQTIGVSIVQSHIKAVSSFLRGTDQSHPVPHGERVARNR
jgi:hypothetical protein